MEKPDFSDPDPGPSSSPPAVANPMANRAPAGEARDKGFFRGFFNKTEESPSDDNRTNSLSNKFGLKLIEKANEMKQDMKRVGQRLE